MRMGTQQQNSILFELAGYQQLGARRCESWILSHEPLGKIDLRSNKTITSKRKRKKIKRSEKVQIKDR